LIAKIDPSPSHSEKNKIHQPAGFSMTGGWLTINSYINMATILKPRSFHPEERGIKNIIPYRYNKYRDPSFVGMTGER
jgi:hypothetical protein